MKGIKREFSVAKTPQWNGVAKRKNRTLIEAARTMLVDSKLPTTFWAEAVNTACYVLNRVLVIKPHNKTPYELIRGRPPLIDFMKLFGCHVTILNTRDHLGKFDGKADEGYFVGYSVASMVEREDLEGDDLLLHDAEMEVMNMILLSIPNEIYNSVDACTLAKDMWKRVERLMRGTIQNKVDRETRFTNEFVAETGEALVYVYNHFAQLMNDLKRNNMNFPTVTINTKFL
ncbi:ribonuclease H-like domain-containing protein, partial [Tanacetum coccineum]